MNSFNNQHSQAQLDIFLSCVHKISVGGPPQTIWGTSDACCCLKANNVLFAKLQTATMNASKKN